ncbi:MAG: protein phosphatase CheZ [Cycloclasticus sp.]|nr:protein phosphatase CheZ [Cycloclasticus sp.]
MMQNEQDRLELLEKAKQLVANIENNDDAATGEVLSSITLERERSLFREVGQLTRQLHDNLASFALDAQLNDITDKGIPDAKERLNYVIKMTDEAANKTLNAIDEILPVTDEMQQKSEKLSKNWHKFLGRELSLDEFKIMSAEITSYLDESCRNTKFVHAKANDIVLAQSFQDLTGQIIKKVITLVQDVENSLVDLIRIAGAPQPKVAEDKPQVKGQLDGPLVPGIDVQGAVNSQDEVDDLLSSLGF